MRCKRLYRINKHARVATYTVQKNKHTHEKPAVNAHGTIIGVHDNPHSNYQSYDKRADAKSEI